MSTVFCDREFLESFAKILLPLEAELALSGEEKRSYKEEVARFGEEAKTRGIPHPYDTLFGLGDNFAMGKVIDFRFNQKHTAIEYLLKLDESEVWIAEEALGKKS